MDVPTRPRILAMAFNCHPGEGSEGGTGWAWARLLAGIGPTTVLTRPWPGTREAVADALAVLPVAERPTIEFVDMPAWIRPVAGRDAFARAEYVLWQFEARRLVRDRIAAGEFDLAWHVSWANAWIGTTAALFGLPLVYGPVGAGVGPPWRLVPSLGPVGALAEVVRAGSRWAGRWLNPLARRSWAASRLILVQNDDTLRWLPVKARPRAVVMPNAVFATPPPPRLARPPGRPRRALYAGRLVGWKGLGLAIAAMRHLPDWSLVVLGDGRDGGRLQRHAVRTGVADRVSFLGWQPRDEVLRQMREEVDVLVFPSLHDEAGWTVAEAVAIGLPVVCLDRGGPPALGGSPVRATTPSATARRLAHAIRAVADTTPSPGRWSTDLTIRRVEVVDLLSERGLLHAHRGG
jgi:glycosyltransferase involved in cell wall biosynthesis